MQHCMYDSVAWVLAPSHGDDGVTPKETFEGEGVNDSVAWVLAPSHGDDGTHERSPMNTGFLPLHMVMMELLQRKRNPMNTGFLAPSYDGDDGVTPKETMKTLRGGGGVVQAKLDTREKPHEYWVLGPSHDGDDDGVTPKKKFFGEGEGAKDFYNKPRAITTAYLHTRTREGGLRKPEN